MPAIAYASRPLQPEEMWGASRHLRLETKPKCELSQGNFQILAFWSTRVIKQTVNDNNKKSKVFFDYGSCHFEESSFFPESIFF